MKNRLKIFIISPNDVEIERKAVVDVCQNINNQLQKKLTIEPIIWEQHTMDYIKNPQENINKELFDSDIYIVILWNRIGSTVEGLKGEITNETDITGTQYEIEYILKHKRESIYFYFKRKELKVNINDAKDIIKQKDKLDNFLKKIELSKNSTKRSYQEFKTLNEFKEKIYSLIKKELKNRFNIDIIQTLKLAKKYNNVKYEPSPVYYMGLYVFLGAIIGVLFAIISVKSSLSKDIKMFYTSFAFAFYIYLIPLVKDLPISIETTYIATFKEVFFALLRRALFLLISALIVGFAIWYLILPQIREFFQFIFR